MVTHYYTVINTLYAMEDRCYNLESANVTQVCPIDQSSIGSHQRRKPIALQHSKTESCDREVTPNHSQTTSFPIGQL